MHDVSADLYALACQPDLRVRLYSACVVGGVRYHTVDREKNRKTQNSGIISEGEHEGEIIDFFGQLKSIIKLQYNCCSGVHGQSSSSGAIGLTLVVVGDPESMMMDTSKA